MQTQIKFKTRPLVRALFLSSALSTGFIPGLVSPAYAQTHTQFHTADIKAGELAQALIIWSETTGLGLSLNAELITGKTARGLKGEFSAKEGFETLLQDSGLVAEFKGHHVLIHSAAIQASQLTPITVTSATKTERNIDGVIASVEVISRQDIEKTGATTLRGVLLKQPSLTLQYARFPHPSSVSKSSISIRGAGANGTLILVDGKRLPGETESPYEIDRIPLDMIDRIEIVKGAMSTLYGSDAMGGVINIITKSVDQPQTSLNVQYGQNGQGDAQEKNIAFHHLGRQGQWGYGVYGSFIHSTPFKVTLPYTQVAKNPQTHAVVNVPGISAVSGQEGVTYRDDAQVNSLGGRVSYDFSDQTRLGIELGWTAEHREGHYIGAHQFPNAGNPVMVNNTPVKSVDDNNRRDVSIDLTHDFDQNALLKLRVYTSLYEKRNVTSSKTFNAPDNKKFSADVQIDAIEATVNLLNLNNHLVTFGGEYRKETRHSSAINPNPQSTDFITKVVEYKSAFIQDEIDLGRGWSANVGARYDDISNADQKTTFKLGVLKALTEQTRIRANFSQGYRAPDIAELYVVAPYFRDARRFGSEVIFGPKQNTYRLKPETSETFELALAHTGERLKAELVAFRNVIHDKIELVAKNNGMPNKYYTSENLDKVEINGLELSGAYQFNAQWAMKLDSVWMKPINTMTDKNLTYTPELSASMGIDYQPIEPLSLNLTGRYIGEQFIDEANQQRLSGYALVDAGLSYRVNKQMRVYGGIHNLADKSVDLKAGGDVGRYFYLGANYQF